VNRIVSRRRAAAGYLPKQFGISARKYFDVIPVMAALALASGSPLNNPRIPTTDEIAARQRQVWA
jgi:hypothetical protein